MMKVTGQNCQQNSDCPQYTYCDTTSDTCQFNTCLQFNGDLRYCNNTVRCPANCLCEPFGGGVGIDICVPSSNHEFALPTEERENFVEFHLSGLDNFAFTYKEHMVTKDQPFNTHITTAHLGSHAEMLINAGRKKSKPVADWFKQKIGTSNGAAIGIDSNKHLPDELNFAVLGDLLFETNGKKYHLEDVVIGQGSEGFMNNWWFGGEGWERRTVPEVPLIAQGVIKHIESVNEEVIIGATFEPEPYKFHMATIPKIN